MRTRLPQVPMQPQSKSRARSAKPRQYRVNWGIDIYASSPLDAARQARAIQRDPNSTATFFHVEDDKAGTITHVDLSESS